MNFFFVITLIVCLIASIVAQKSKGSPELLEPIIFGNDVNHEALTKISAQILNVLAELESLQNGNQQLKMAEKRRNKFEFIRFGRK